MSTTDPNTQLEAIRDYFVQELMNQRLRRYSAYPTAINSVIGVAPNPKYRVGYTVGPFIKAELGNIVNTDVTVPQPSIQYTGETFDYPHPSGGTRTLPYVPLFTYTPITPENLNDITDLSHLKNNVLLAFPINALPNETPDFENTNWGYYLFEGWENIPVTGDLVSGVWHVVTFSQVLQITSAQISSLYQGQRTLTLGGQARYFNVLLHDVDLTYQARDVGAATYDSQSSIVKAIAIYFYAEYDVTEVYFNRKISMTPSGSPATKIYVQWPTSSGLSMYLVKQLP